jgi:translocation and assembly module TamB
MRLIRRILLSLPVILLLLVIGIYGLLHSDFFWRWAGGKLVTLAEGECHCAISVDGIDGNPFDGLFFKNVVFATPEGEVIHAKSLEIKMSFWSLFRLSPLISKVAVMEPHLNIRQEKDGEWNIVKILPPPPKQLPVNIVKVKVDHILIINGEGEIAQGSQTQKFTNLDLDMDLDVENPVTPNQAIKVGKAMAGVTTSFGRVNLTSGFTYAHDSLEVQHFDIATGEKTLLSMVGKGNMTPGGEFQVNGKLDLPPQEIQKVWAKWPPTWDAATRFQVKGTRSQFNLTLTGKVQELSFDITGALGSQAGTWHYDLQGKAQHFNPDLLTIFDKSLAQKLDKVGPLDAKFHVQGTDLTFPPAQFSWNVEIEAFEYGSARVDKLKLSLTGDKNSQQVIGSIQGPVGDLSLEASGSLFSGKQGKFCLKLDSFKSAPLGLGVHDGTIITATLGGDFSSPGLDALDRLKVNGVMVANGTIGQHPLNDLYVSLAWSKNRLEIARGEVQLGNLTAELHGTLVGDKLDFSFQGQSGSGGNWPIPAQVGGQFSWEGTATGSLADPQVALKARGQGLAYEKFGMKTVNLNAQISGWPPAKGRIDFQATGVKTPVGVFSQANFRSDGGGKLWNYDLRATGPENAKIEVRGNADLGRYLVSADRAVIHLKNFTVQNQGPVEVILSPGLEVKPATFQVNKGRVSLQARITDQQASGQLDIQNLAAGLVAPQSLPLKGTISAHATLAGTARQPVLQGDLHLERGRYQEFELQAIQTSFSYRENRLTLEGSLKTKEQGPGLTWSGQVPMRLSLLPFSLARGQGEIRVVVQGNNINLSLLPALVKEVESAQGALNLQARIEGTISQPRVSGQVAWGAGAIKLRATGATYQLQPGEIRLQGDRITIPQLTLQSDGTMSLTGDITLSGFQPDEVRARVQINNFKAIDKLGSEAYINGAINLDGRWPKLALKGNVTIPQAHLRLSFLNLGPSTVNKDVILVRQQSPEKPLTPKPKAKKAKVQKESEVWKDLSVHLDVQAPNNIWIDDRLAKIEVAVNVAVRKQPGQELAYSGEVKALHGQVAIVGREFQVTRGVVTLPALPGAEPTVNARIQYEANDVILYAEATGPVSNPKIALGGEPAISETDWMAYLLYGRPVASLSREEQGALSAAGAFGGLATRMILKDLLGMAPPITKGLTISYQQRNDPLYRDDPYQVVINYRINRRFSVQSQVGGRNTGGDVLFNFDF